MIKKELKQKLIDIRNGALITPLLEELTNNYVRLNDVSAWAEYGRKKGYWDYFKEEAIKEFLGSDEGKVYQDYTPIKKE